MSHLTATWREFENYFKKKEVNLSMKKILDIGCKNNTSQKFFEELGIKWFGIDKNPQQPQGEVFTMDMTDIKFSEKYFDILFICHSFEHCENPILALKEMNNILIDNGYIFISLPCACKHHILKSDEDHLFVLNEMQIERLLRYTGFKEIDCFKGTEGGYGKDDDGYEQFNLICVARK